VIEELSQRYVIALGKNAGQEAREQVVERETAFVAELQDHRRDHGLR
jgi:hypothetical protein